MGGRPKIALIEDDPMIRTALARAIDDANYDVISAASGPEGIALLNDQTVDVAVVDVVLPGFIDGIAVVREARQHNPDLRVIFTSGYPPPADVDLATLGEFMPKPSRVPTILATIARQLGLKKAARNKA
ncbi:MAG: response regulator [Alphaproteobacteria bacterium]|nr:response regulator [Alphaproteobacteria bacterium]